MTTPQAEYSGAVPLSAPLYGASLGAAVRRFFKKYATFSGRASRSEYWWWVLVATVVMGGLRTLAIVFGGDGQLSADGTTVVYKAEFWVFTVLLGVWVLATIVPSYALFVRRLHDSNLAGPFAFLSLIPYVGGLIVLILAIRLSVPEGARFDR